MLGAFMAVLDIQITNASLRYITGGISAAEDEGSWIPTSYLIGEIITIPLAAWLSRFFSVRRYLLVNVILFLIFSCLCGTAHGPGGNDSLPGRPRIYRRRYDPHFADGRPLILAEATTTIWPRSVWNDRNARTGNRAVASADS
jgi:MFS family permease